MQSRQYCWPLRQQQPFKQLVVYFAYDLDLCKDSDRNRAAADPVTVFFLLLSTHITPGLAWPDQIGRLLLPIEREQKKVKDHSRWPDKHRRTPQCEQAGCWGHACAGSSYEAHARRPPTATGRTLELYQGYGPLARMLQTVRQTAASGRFLAVLLGGRLLSIALATSFSNCRKSCRGQGQHFN